MTQKAGEIVKGPIFLSIHIVLFEIFENLPAFLFLNSRHDYRPKNVIVSDFLLCSFYTCDLGVLFFS